MWYRSLLISSIFLGTQLYGINDLQEIKASCQKKLAPQLIPAQIMFNTFFSSLEGFNFSARLEHIISIAEYAIDFAQNEDELEKAKKYYQEAAARLQKEFNEHLNRFFQSTAIYLEVLGEVQECTWQTP